MTLYLEMKKLLSEFIGMMTLAMGVVGSGIMAENISQGNEGITLLINSIATVGILIVIITTFRTISGAHFNPAVSFSFYIQGNLNLKIFIQYTLIHILGGIIGVILVHFMIEVPIEMSTKDRTGLNKMLSEVIASFLLILIICMSQKRSDVAVGVLVGVYIGSGYFFTSSTSFANPAITIARSLSDTYTGISFDNVPVFIVSQFIGAYLATKTYQIIER